MISFMKKESLKNLLVLILVGIIVISCGEKNPNTYFDVSKITETLPAQLVYQFEDKCVSDIDIVDSFMVGIQIQSDTSLFVLNLNTNKIVSGLGVAGGGPNDVISPDFIQSAQKDSTGSLYFDDINTGKRLKLNMRNGSSNFVFEKLVGFPENDFQVSNLCLSSRLIVGREIGQKVESMFFIYDRKTDSIKDINFFPVIEGPLNDRNYFQATHLLLNDKKNTIVAGMYFLDMVQLYDLKGKMKKVIVFSEEYIPKIDKKNQALDISEGYSGIERMYATEEYFYVKRAHFVKDKGESVILKINWEGLVVGAFRVQEELFGSFCVDEKSQKLFAIQHKIENLKEYYNIVYYDLVPASF